MSKIPFILITGFLGSGKTTFLQNIIAQTADDHKIGIIQNEFSPTGIDGRELKRSDNSFELLEINRGSVFCVCLLNDFVKSLNDFIEQHKPDMIFLEASGLADPINLSELLADGHLQQKLFLHSIWTMVDAANFYKIKKSVKRSVHQIKVADMVILNKMDLVNESEIHTLKQSVKDINPIVKIIETKYADVDFKEYLDFQTLFAINPVECENTKPIDITSCTLKTSDKLNIHDIDYFLNDIKQYVYRLKGYVALSDNSTAFIQITFDHSEFIIRNEISHKTEFIGIGAGLKARDLRNILKKYVKEEEYERNS